MKITTKPLKEALTRLRGISSGRTTMPILHCVKLESDGVNLSITASDLDSWQVERVESDEKLEPICVNFKHFESAIGGEHVTITKDGNHIIIKHGKSVMKLAMMSAEEFPKLPEGKRTIHGINCEALADSIMKVQFACVEPKSERHILKAVHIQSNAKELRIEASDSRQGAIVREPLINATFEALIQQSLAIKCAETLTREDSELFIGENHVMIKHKFGYYWCKQTEGMYPKTEGIYSAGETLGVIQTKPLIEILETCVSLADSVLEPAAEFVFSNNGLSVKFTGANASFENDIEGEFKPMECKANCAKVISCLRAIKSDTCEISDAVRGDALGFQSGNLFIVSMKMRTQPAK